MSLSKQLLIQDLLRVYKIDILACQEVSVNNDTFNNCDFISANYTLVSNNSHNEFGTLFLIKNNFPVNDIYMDTEGRAICINLGDFTIGNFYPIAGTDAICRQNREKMFSETIPNLLLNRKQSGILLGDWNSIVNNRDCTHYPDSKKSPSLRRLLDLYHLQDTHCVLHPNHQDYSHYYSSSATNTGATRIDRAYSYGQTHILQSEYVPVAFSDHLGYNVSIKLKNDIKKFVLPKSKPFFKISPAVVEDSVFQGNL